MENDQYLKEGHSLSKGKYTIIRTIGEGGFAKTYLARNNADSTANPDKLVVIKEFFLSKCCCRASDSYEVLTKDVRKGHKYVEVGRHKFLGEIQKLHAISSPNIIKVYDQFEENNTLYYVMEYIQGGSLEDYIRLHGTLDEYKAKDFINKIGYAIKVMHAHHMLHLDIKPSNVLLRNPDDVVLCDFGAAKLYNEKGRECSHSPYITSGGFSAPEQYVAMELHHFAPATDVYGLGATLFFLLTGKVPDVNEDWLLERFNRPVRLAILNSITYREKRIQSVDGFLDVLNGKVEITGVKRRINRQEELVYESGFM